MRQPRTDEELFAAAGEVGYELTQCAAAVTQWRTGTWDHDKLQPVENALIESAALHVRALAEFLLSKKNDPRDIHRDDFTPGDLWTPAPHDCVPRLEQARMAADKHLAHLTWRRVEGPPDEREWKFDQLVQQDLMAVFTAWLEHVEDSREVPARRIDPVTWELRKYWYAAWYFLNGQPPEGAWPQPQWLP